MMWPCTYVKFLTLQTPWALGALPVAQRGSVGRLFPEQGFPRGEAMLAVPLALMESGSQQEVLQHVLRTQRGFGICPLSSRNSLRCKTCSSCGHLPGPVPVNLRCACVRCLCNLLLGGGFEASEPQL